MPETFHSIQVLLHPNLLTAGGGDFLAKVISDGTLSVREVCQSAVTRGRAATTIETMEYNVNLFLKEMCHLLLEGFAVNAGCFTARATIKGVFKSRKETYDPARHSIVIRFVQGEMLRKELPKVKVVVAGAGSNKPEINVITDVKTGSVNHLVTPQHNLRIRGQKLKITGDNPTTGVWFVNPASGSRLRVEPGDIVINKPTELLVMVPPLAAGAYHLEVATQYAGSSIPLKQPRTSKFEWLLTVE